MINADDKFTQILLQKGIETDLGLQGGADLRGLRAGGLFVTDGNLAESEMDVEIEDFALNPHREVVDEGKATMLRVALDALSML